MMSNEPNNNTQTESENTIGRSASSYASLVLDHFEQLANLQFEAAKAYADTSVQQARTALEVKDSSDVGAYMENQQTVAKEMSERFRDDMGRLVSLNLAFAQNAQQVAQDSAEEEPEAAEDSREKAAQDETQKEPKAAKESSKKSANAA